MTPLWLSWFLFAYVSVMSIAIGILWLCAAKYGWQRVGVRTWTSRSSPEAKRKLDHDVGHATLYSSVFMLVASLLFMVLAPLPINTRVFICAWAQFVVFMLVSVVRVYIIHQRDKGRQDIIYLGERLNDTFMA